MDTEQYPLCVAANCLEAFSPILINICSRLFISVVPSTCPPKHTTHLWLPEASNTNIGETTLTWMDCGCQQQTFSPCNLKRFHKLYHCYQFQSGYPMIYFRSLVQVTFLYRRIFNYTVQHHRWLRIPTSCRDIQPVQNWQTWKSMLVFSFGDQ